MRFLKLLPFLFFIATGVVLVGALYTDKQSTSLEGKAMPPIALDVFQGQVAGDGAKKTVLYNLFATWCTPCIAELPYLQKLSEEENVEIIGIAWKDDVEKLAPWLERYGNPYTTIYLDPDGAYGISLGIRGLPESFIVDEAQTIRFHHGGPITSSDLGDVIKAIHEAAGI